MPSIKKNPVNTKTIKENPPKTKMKRERYSDETKQKIIDVYPHLREVQDKIEAAERLGIKSLPKLYNLASRLGVTDEYDTCYDAQGNWIYAEAYYPRGDWDHLKKRMKPEDINWTAKDDGYIDRRFGNQFIEEIRFVREYTEIAVAYRARHLGKRKACFYWDRRKVCLWLGLKPEQLMRLGEKTLRSYPCANRDGDVKIILISTEELARTILKNQLWKELLANGADEFFIREIIESYIEIKEGKHEPSVWISHGHTNLCPLDEDGFEMFYTEPSKWMMGERYTPQELSPKFTHLLREYR